jgi:hypothetical protein
LFVWKAIQLHFGWQKIAQCPFPDWVIKCLLTAATRLVDLAEGLDWSKAPEPPGRGANEATIRNYGRRLGEWQASQIRTVKAGTEDDIVMRVFGFSQKKGRNVFTAYAKELDLQREAEAYSRFRIWYDMRRGGARKGKSGPISAAAERSNEDRSNLGKRLRAGQRSLNLGRLEENPFGPAAARTTRRQLGKK